MTDTPVTRPPTPLERLKGFIGDLARPFAIYTISGTTAWSILDSNVDAGKLTAAGVIVAVLFGAKTVENQTQARQTASVEIARAGNVPAAVAAAPGDGELPAAQRYTP